MSTQWPCSVEGVRRNLRRAGVLKNRFRTLTLVPTGPGAGFTGQGASASGLTAGGPTAGLQVGLDTSSAGVKAGLQASLEVPQYPGRKFTGKVTRTAEVIEPAQVHTGAGGTSSTAASISSTMWYVHAEPQRVAQKAHE